MTNSLRLTIYWTGAFFTALGLMAFASVGYLSASSHIEDQIISPMQGEVVSGTLTLEAVYSGDPNDTLFWAVREGNCAAGTNTVFGNVDGLSSLYTWEDGIFIASFDISEFSDGEYCFIFNPGGNTNDVRETSEFSVGEVEDPAPEPNGNPVSKEDCKEGGWESFNFLNQGQCIRFINTDQDSR